MGDDVVLVGGEFAMKADVEPHVDLVISSVRGLDLDVVVEIDSVKNRLDLVKAVVAATEYAQEHIYLGVRAHSNGQVINLYPGTGESFDVKVTNCLLLQQR